MDIRLAFFKKHELEKTLFIYTQLLFTWRNFMKTQFGFSQNTTTRSKENKVRIFRFFFPLASILTVLLSSCCTTFIAYDRSYIPRATEDKKELSIEEKEKLEAVAALKVIQANENLKEIIQDTVSDLSSTIQALHEARGVFLETENKDRKLHDCLDKQIRDSQSLLNFLNEYRKVINGTYKNKVLYYDYKLCDEA